MSVATVPDGDPSNVTLLIVQGKSIDTSTNAAVSTPPPPVNFTGISITMPAPGSTADATAVVVPSPVIVAGACQNHVSPVTELARVSETSVGIVTVSPLVVFTVIL